MTARTAYDIVVVGCGMAGLAAANRAAELERSVAVLEKSPKERRGGHTQYSESFRVPSTECDLKRFGYEFAIQDYTPDDFYADIMNQTNNRADPNIARTLVENAGPTVEWLTVRGAEWNMEPLNVGYTAARTFMDGEENVTTLVEAAEDDGAEFYYRTEARELLQEDGYITGIRALTDDGEIVFETDAVVVGAGGYESSPERRTRYYGPEYDAMKVRGSRYNTGEGIEMTLDAGGKAEGQWGGAHMALIDANSPDVEGGANRVDGYQYGVIINDEGERFVDEGADARAHTYARFGHEIFEQPNHVAYIVVDAPLRDHMRATGPSDVVAADTIEGLLAELGCGDPGRGTEVIREFSAACDPNNFNPDMLDGNEAVGVKPPKSNWALPLDEPPYYGWAVTGGITFGFGGVATDIRARVLDTVERPIPGLYAAGNSVGGLFFDNYPGGTGLSNAAVYGKIAAEEAVEYLGKKPDRSAVT